MLMPRGTPCNLPRVVRAWREGGVRRLSDRVRDDNSKLRLALRAAPLGIWGWDLLTNEMNYSPRATHLRVHSDEAVTIEKVRNVTHPEYLLIDGKIHGCSAPVRLLPPIKVARLKMTSALAGTLRTLDTCQSPPARSECRGC